MAHAEIAADATELDEIVVTGTRTDVAIEDSLVPAQVIDREEIERTQARSLPELLKGRAGSNITNQGGAGKLTSVFLRGAESDHVLVLVDGVRIGSATAGLASFQDLPVDQIERIEIIRGPRSSLYGSEAIGGVIQIFTRKGGMAFRRISASAAAATTCAKPAPASATAASAAGSAPKARIRKPTVSMPAAVRRPLFQGCFADEPDRDGYRNLSAVAARRHRPRRRA